MRRIALAGWLACVAAGTAAAQEIPGPERFALRFEYRRWRPKLTSEIQYGSLGLTGTLIDLQRDLGLPDEDTLELRGAIQLAPGHRLRGSYTSLEYSGDTPISRQFDFGGTRYLVSTRVVSTVEAGYFLAAYEWDFVRTPAGIFGAMLGAGAFLGDATVAAPDLAVSETRELDTPIGALGVTGRFYAGRLSFQGEFSGLKLKDRGHLWELELSGRLHVSDRFALQAGYRSLDVRGEDAPDFATVKLKGVFFGAEITL